LAVDIRASIPESEVAISETAMPCQADCQPR
jgi:hypothetical protein